MNVWCDRAAVWLAAPLMLGILACSSPSESGSSDSGSGKGLATSCPTGLPGPALVFIAAGDTPFCIDARETTQRDYDAFLRSAQGTPPTQSAECSDNTSFYPPDYSNDPPPSPNQVRHPGCTTGLFSPGTLGDYSVACVDWCDAKAYCEWAGKRLCGGLGGAAETWESPPESSNSEWYYACSAGGTLAYPYGQDYELGRCIDENVSPQPTSALTTGSPTCHGPESPYDAIFDMGGSLSEWTSARGEVGIYAYGYAWGGSYSTVEAGCADRGLSTPVNRFPAVGIRCCADGI